MKQRSRVGAARVSAVWMIVLIVLFFVALAFGYISQQDRTTAIQERDAALAAQAEAETRFDEVSSESIEISKRLGFYDESVVGARSDLTAAGAGFDQLRTTFTDLDQSVDSFSKAIPVVVAQYQARVREIETLNDKIKEQQGQLQALRGQLTQVSSEKDDEIANLQQQLSDAENAAREAQDALESRVAAITADRNDKDASLRETRAQIEDLQREREKDKQAATTRFTALSDKLRFTKEPTKPDGEILAVSKELGLGWIDLGTVNRLNRGMAFRVVSGDPASERDKGWARVTDKIDEKRAEVRFFDTVDRFDPIVPGDKIYNPLFDPVGRRNAVLVGRFSGEYNEKELAILLDEIGITAQKKLDLDTDYLIVGSEMYQDPETGETLEDPIQPSDLPVYKNAQELGTQIVSIRDLTRYFKK